MSENNTVIATELPTYMPSGLYGATGATGPTGVISNYDTPSVPFCGTGYCMRRSDYSCSNLRVYIMNNDLENLKRLSIPDDMKLDAFRDSLYCTFDVFKHIFDKVNMPTIILNYCGNLAHNSTWDRMKIFEFLLDRIDFQHESNGYSLSFFVSRLDMIRKLEEKGFKFTLYDASMCDYVSRETLEYLLKKTDRSTFTNKKSLARFFMRYITDIEIVKELHKFMGHLPSRNDLAPFGTCHFYNCSEEVLIYLIENGFEMEEDKSEEDDNEKDEDNEDNYSDCYMPKNDLLRNVAYKYPDVLKALIKREGVKRLYRAIELANLSEDEELARLIASHHKNMQPDFYQRIVMKYAV